MTKKCAKVAPAGISLGFLLAPLARLWAPLGLNWSSVWLPFAPPASSNFNFLAKPRKWIQNTQNGTQMDSKSLQNISQNEAKTNTEHRMQN